MHSDRILEARPSRASGVRKVRNSGKVGHRLAPRSWFPALVYIPPTSAVYDTSRR